MKKVLIFSLAYYPNQVSGAEAAIKEITDRLTDIEFHLVTLRYNSILSKEEKIGNVFVHRIGLASPHPTFNDLGKLPLDLNKPLYQFLAAFKAARLHNKYHFDGIWAMMAHSAGVPAALFKIFHPQVKYLLTLQEGDPIDYIERKMKPLWPLFTKAFTLADKVQPISGFLANWAKQRNVSEDKITIIHNGANPRDLAGDVSETDIKHLKEKLNKQPTHIYLVNTARLVQQKANDDVIRALTMLPDNIKLLLVGEGDDEQLLKNLAAELKVSERVIFVGHVNRSQITAYRRVSDIFVCPSRSEGLGNAFLSAMASRLPVIATQEGGLAEFISTETAWVVAKDSPEQIAQAVKNILADPDKAKTITASARKMVEEKYNWDNIAQDIKNKIFDKI